MDVGNAGMPVYRNVQYLKDSDGLWKVAVNGSLFVVALDDSKPHGRRTIVWQRNTPQTCKEYIDWILEA